MNSRQWLVYLLRCADGSFYTGMTNDLPKRLQAHQHGKASRYTRSRLPVKLVYLESAANRSAAAKREVAIKRMRRKEKMGLVQAEKVKQNVIQEETFLRQRRGLNSKKIPTE
jgi:predicted GIY-YIG superfamily endonuclease